MLDQIINAELLLSVFENMTLTSLTHFPLQGKIHVPSVVIDLTKSKWHGDTMWLLRLGHKRQAASVSPETPSNLVSLITLGLQPGKALCRPPGQESQLSPALSPYLPRCQILKWRNSLGSRSSRSAVQIPLAFWDPPNWNPWHRRTEISHPCHPCLNSSHTICEHNKMVAVLHY